MSFNVLTIRTGGETGDDALYPLLSDQSCPEVISLDRYDGPNVTSVVATAVRVLAVGGDLKQIARLREVKIDVYITDGRLALACEKYDKGGGWVGFGGGGALVAVTANTVSKIRAASRSRGKVLVGHIRFPWIKAVGASSKSGFGSAEAIRLEFSEKSSGTTTRKMVELTLPKNIDATLVAQEIVRRAAAYRLAHYPDMTEAERGKFASLRQAPPRLQPPPREFAFCQMPTYYFVGAGSAFPRPSQPDAALPAAASAPDGQIRGDAIPLVPAPVDADRAPGSDHAPIFCTQCGTPGTAADNFCAECGTPMHGGAGSLPGSSVAAN